MGNNLPRLVRLLRCVGYSLTEAQDAIHSHRFGDGYGTEALAHGGGSARVIGLAFQQRQLWHRSPRYTQRNAPEFGAVVGPEARGAAAYAEDCQRAPLYHDGQPRPVWAALPYAVQRTWVRNPTPRNHGRA